ncbi:DUF5986 family protein [Oceanobacillus chungangensis]|uniref:Uncharacterized protein n=1 Tax=Oceanobacillus chungangensis TaxID=1229152 RepID=A0A3D8PSS9_9BACI|nr:DUF5986 family protein [Oceanobacillus chungangensis]RDW18772.1 hypothetical protein CWR45_09260 [Oceanobacillus chungangensis]
MINLGNEVVKEIVNTLVASDSDSRLLYLQSINNESGEGTQNSRAIQKWDYRYNNILKVAKNFGLKYIKLGRGKLWEAILIQGPENEIYVFFSKTNLNRIIRRGKHNHYLRLLNLFNQDLDELKPLSQQLALPVYNEEVEKKDDWKMQAREMLHMMETDPSKVIVFAFDTSFVSIVKAFAFNTKHELVWEEDFSELIDVNYHSVLKDDNVEPAIRESSNINNTKEEKKRIVKLKG